MSQKIKNILLQSLPITLLATLFVAAVIYAWTEPKKAPPEGNVDEPLNVRDRPQVKNGGLSVNSFISNFGTILAKDSSNVGIGTTTPSAKLEIVSQSTSTPGLKLVAPSNSGAGNEISICKNGTCCPIWKDCDGDGKTYGNGDCDESCSTCYVDSLKSTEKTDGHDQDCNGIVDDVNPVVKTVVCYSPKYQTNIEFTGSIKSCDARCKSEYPDSIIKPELYDCYDTKWYPMDDCEGNTWWQSYTDCSYYCGKACKCKCNLGGYK